MATFGEAVSVARKALGLSQRELAARVKKEDGEQISPQYLNDIERDRRSAPSQHLILQFAQVLKLEPDYLFALAQAWPKDILEKLERSSPETSHKKTNLGFYKRVSTSSRTFDYDGTRLSERIRQNRRPCDGNDRNQTSVQEKYQRKEGSGILNYFIFRGFAVEEIYNVLDGDDGHIVSGFDARRSDVRS